MNASKILDRQAKNALRAMREAGFRIKGPVRFAVDEHLPFMGYTTFQGQEHVIVIAGKALCSGMIEGLLIHELSHVYRTETNHPSHNRILLNEIAKQITETFKIQAKYQVKILQEIVDHVQDLYADDIAFQVFINPDRVGEFFLDWMTIESICLKNKRMKTWIDLAAMLKNTFVISNLERHHIEQSKEAAKIQEIFLSRIDKHLSGSSAYFRKAMANLKENLSGQEFKQQLLRYMACFIELTVSSHTGIVTSNKHSTR